MRKLTEILIVALLALFMATPAIAEDGVACITIYPCDEDGNLLDEYFVPEDPCFIYYIGQCLQSKVTSLSENLKFCEFEKASLSAKASDYDSSVTKIRKLRKKLRKLRKARR